MKKEDILISRAANLSVADLFEIQAKNNPKLLAVQDVDGKKYQYRQTLNRVLKISKIFINKGVKPKDRIAIISENRKEYLEIEMACAKIGAILVAINWRLSDNEINYCINLVKPKFIYFFPHLIRYFCGLESFIDDIWPFSFLKPSQATAANKSFLVLKCLYGAV